MQVTLSQSGLHCLGRLDHSSLITGLVDENTVIGGVIIQSGNKLTTLWDAIALGGCSHMMSVVGGPLGGAGVCV